MLAAEIEPNDSFASATSFAFGNQRLEGTIADGDVDWFKIDLQSGQRLIVGRSGTDTSGSASRKPRFEVRDASGSVWASSNVGRDDGFTVVDPGTYYVGLFADNIIQTINGSYSVAALSSNFGGTVEAEPNSDLATATQLSGSEFRGSLTSTDVDVFAKSFQTGDAVSIKYANGKGPAAELIDPSGQVVASDTSGLGLAVTVAVAGRYQLRLTEGPNSFTGDYVSDWIGSPRGSTEGGNSFESAGDLSVAITVPGAALGTSDDFATQGLVGSYINYNLRGRSTQDDWRASQAIAGTRVDPEIAFTSSGWGTRAEVGLTAGSDTNWDNYSVQWDGFIQIPTDGYRLATSSDDGSRMWIDSDNNGDFEANEYVSNGWGLGQGTTLGPFSQSLGAGVYPIRLQYEEGGGGNTMTLVWTGADASGAQATRSGGSAAGMLTSIGEADFYKIRLDANQRYRFQISDGFTNLWPSPDNGQGSDGRRISIYNEFGQWLESSYSNSTTSNIFFARPERSGVHYVVIEALSQKGLGGYSLSTINEPFGSSRRTSVIATDYSQHSQSELNDIVDAGIRAIYAPFQTEVTRTEPTDHNEYITFQLRPDTDTNRNWCGGFGGGQYGGSRPNGDGWVGRGSNCGTWNEFSDIWYDGIMHELGHAHGIPHAYHPRTGATLYPVGSYLLNYDTAGFTVPFLQQERRYVDWITQAGEQQSESEPNDNRDDAQELDAGLARMSTIGNDSDDQLVMAGRIESEHDVDLFSISILAGETITFDIDSSEFQLGLNSRLTILDDQGNELASNNDARDPESQIVSHDPSLKFVAPSAGKYFVEVRGEGLSIGHYRLKVTPERAADATAPRIYYVWPQPSQPVNRTRQIILWVDDLLDPDTVNNSTFVLEGASSGVHSGSFHFDALDSTVIFTADALLPIDTYTLTINGSSSGVKDLWGNVLDGETSSVLAYPNVSGNGSAGGDFVTTFQIGSQDNSPAVVTSLSLHDPANGSRDAANRWFFTMRFDDEMDLVSIAQADWTLRSSGSDGVMDTVDDELREMDAFFHKQGLDDGNTLSLYALGNPPPGDYRIDADVLDAAGRPINIRRPTFVGDSVDPSLFFQDAAATQPGIIGTYFNQSLRSAGAENDWRTTRAPSGSRIDPQIDFDTFSWGDRSETGVTGGSSHWDDFSVQWDGYVRIDSDGTQLVSESDDGSRFWIDANGNGTFEADELYDNDFGTGHATQLGEVSQGLTPGVYAIRIQYEEGFGGNVMRLKSSSAANLDWQRVHFAPVVTSTSIPAFEQLQTPFQSISVQFGSQLDPTTLTPDAFRVRYSVDSSFFNDDDVILAEDDASVHWDPIARRATWTPANVPTRGYYLVELDGESGGIAGPSGALLDGEYIDSYIPGGGVFHGWQKSPSGDSIPGGSYRWTFMVNTTEMEFGDAPTAAQSGFASNYPVTLSDDGARHRPSTLRLGDNVDYELDGTPAADAGIDGISGDDQAGIDDEDGALFGRVDVGSVMAGLNIDMQGAATARIDAWIDFDRDGAWGASEKIIDSAAVIAGLQTLNYALPSDLMAGDTYARVRLSSDGSLLPTGEASDGEVEDYRVTIFEDAPRITTVDVADPTAPQRSNVDSLAIRFEGLVEADENAFEVYRRDAPNQMVTTSFVLSNDGEDNSIATLSFTGVMTRGLGMLHDGNYVLRVHHDKVRRLGSTAELDGNDDGLGGDDYFLGLDDADRFFAFFGDSDGDRDVDGQDYGRFGTTFLKTQSDVFFNPHFDWESDGDVDGQDYGQFGLRFLKSLS